MKGIRESWIYVTLYLKATGGLFWELFNIFTNGQIVDGNKLGYNC